MNERKELKELVVIFLKNSEAYPTASEMYYSFKGSQEQMIKHIPNVKSFAKIIKSFKVIESLGSPGTPLCYKLKE